MHEYRNAAGTMIAQTDPVTGHVTIIEPGHPQWAAAVAAGPSAFVPPPPALEDYSSAVQAQIDAVARSRRYDSGVSLASYIGDPNPTWAAEAAAFVDWRSAVWSQVYALWAEPPEPLPTPAEVVAGLPAIVWP